LPFAAANIPPPGPLDPPAALLPDSIDISLRDLVSQLALATENFSIFLTVLSIDARELAEEA
jgi:hypothetical protein